MSGQHSIRNHPHALPLGPPRRRRTSPATVALTLLVLSYAAVAMVVILP